MTAPRRTEPRTPCPVLHTARLTLGPHDVADYEASFAMWADPDVVRYIGGTPSTAEEAWGRQLRYAGLWPLVGYGYWRLLETASGRFVGEAGFGDFRRQITPSLIGVPEAGWVLAAWAHGQGLAYEAMSAILAWADGVLASRRTVCMIDPGNTASLTLAARLGYQTFAEARYKGQDARLLERFGISGRAPDSGRAA